MKLAPVCTSSEHTPTTA